MTSYATPVFSSSVREKAAELLSAITRTLAVKKEDEKKSELGMTADHELYVYCILQEYLHMETALSQPAFSKFQLIREWSEEEKTARATLLEQIEEIRSRSQEGSSMQKLEQVFERLFVNVLLEQIFKPEYSQFIPDLVECYKQFTQQKKRRTDERPLAVLLEIVLILLRTSSKTLRDTAIQLFGNVCDDLQEEDVQDMLSVFWNDEGIEESEEESEEMEMSVNLLFKIAAVGILVSVLGQVLKHSGREEHAFLTSLAGLIIVLFWIVPYIYELFETMQSLFAL